MQKRNVLNSPRLLELKKRRRRTFLNKIFLSLFAFLVIFASLAYLSRINSLNINQIQISGNKIVDTEALKATIEQQIAGKYLWFFPKTNALYYPENKIKNELQSKFKRLKDINLSIKNKTLFVSLSERDAKYMWCGATFLQIDAENQKCYFMDEEGYIFDEAPYFSGEVYFKLFGTSGGLNPDNPLGFSFFKPNFKQLISFKDNLSDIGLKPIALYATSDGDIEIYLSKGKGAVSEPKIIIKADADFQNAAENLQAALMTEPLETNFKTKYSKLQYIDLRFGNKVYSKFQ